MMTPHQRVMDLEEKNAQLASRLAALEAENARLEQVCNDQGDRLESEGRKRAALAAQLERVRVAVEKLLTYLAVHGVDTTELQESLGGAP